MKRLWLIPLIAACLVGCTTDFWADALSRNQKDVNDRIYADLVKDDIKSELRGDQPSNAKSWREFWIKQCTADYQNLGAPYVQYVISQRRAAGLPDIPEVQKLVTDNQK